MFLKSLSMKGFKSFADSTVLEFEPGITVVVGPNGSGKSNVVDAVTWVLGAQGPRALRSAKMEDVIFAGTSSRPPLGRAEVSLTIDNASGRLRVDMAEVTITRTLFRSGDSEYAINGTPCRLLDIQDLLSDSGVGRQQHMIIGQGQLDTVLNARPEDRRAIIEEAAGVLKHRRRRERAERRLTATQENLERLGDLVREVRRQIRPLERQAAAARAHAALAEELRDVRAHVAGLELAELAARRTTAEASLVSLRADQERLEGQLATLDDEASTTAAQLSSTREEDLAGSLGRVQGLVERARGTLAVLHERSRALAAALDAAADVDVVSTLEAEGAHLAVEIQATAAAADGLAPELEALGASEEALDAGGPGELEEEGRRLDRARAEADRAAAGAVDAVERAQEAADTAETTRHRAAARAEALAWSLADQEGASGRALLADVAGVVGALADLVDVDPGWEAAFAAAAGAAVAAVVVDDRDAARRALDRLHRGGVTGAVLAPSPDQGDRPAPSLGMLPPGAEPVRGHVRPRARDGHVAAALDALVGASVRVGDWERAVDLALDRPDLVIVTAGGDRFARSGWQVGASEGGLTAAAVEEAERRAAEAAEVADRLAADLQATRRRAEAARAEADAAAAEVRAALDARRAALSGVRGELEVRRGAIAERHRVLTERLDEVERRLQGHADERAEAAGRRRRLEAEGRALERLEAVVTGERERLESVLASVQRDYRDQVQAVRAGGERLEELRRDRHQAEVHLGELRDRLRTVDLEAAEVALRTDALGDHVRRELGHEPHEVVGREPPPLPDGVDAAAHAEHLAQKLAALGPVNPLALEELAALEERQQSLDGQVNDVRSARRELQEVVRALDEEIMQSFAAAAADVNEHFSSLVAMLFPGGTGRLVLTEPEDLLHTGVEVEVRPMGRNVRRVSLLSGGERSLAALAFLFAVFRSRPSPFYLMDEVEAALDDVNLHRFLGLVREFREEAQLIIVSHQKRTMETGDALYGVTMAPGGSSQVVSQKVPGRRVDTDGNDEPVAVAS
jgi:chromosome segregation protein